MSQAGGCMPGGRPPRDACGRAQLAQAVWPCHPPPPPSCPPTHTHTLAAYRVPEDRSWGRSASNLSSTAAVSRRKGGRGQRGAGVAAAQQVGVMTDECGASTPLAAGLVHSTRPPAVPAGMASHPPTPPPPAYSSPPLGLSSVVYTVLRLGMTRADSWLMRPRVRHLVMLVRPVLSMTLTSGLDP